MRVRMCSFPSPTCGNYRPCVDGWTVARSADNMSLHWLLLLLERPHHVRACPHAT